MIRSPLRSFLLWKLSKCSSLSFSSALLLPWEPSGGLTPVFQCLSWLKDPKTGHKTHVQPYKCQIKNSFPCCDGSIHANMIQCAAGLLCYKAALSARLPLPVNSPPDLLRHVSNQARCKTCILPPLNFIRFLSAHFFQPTELLLNIQELSSQSFIICKLAQSTLSYHLDH